MKKITLLFIALISVISVGAQKKIEVKESNESFSTGSHNSLSVIVYSDDKGEVEKAWKKVLKDMNGDVKMKKEIFADNCLLKKISANSFDVYSKIEEVEGGFRIIAAFDLGGAYLNSGEHKDFFPAIKDIMHKFGVEETKAAMGSIVKVETKKLEDLNDDKKDMEKDVEQMEKDIEDYKKKIEENEKKIKETKESIEKKQGEIKEQEGVVKQAEEKQKAIK